MNKRQKKKLTKRGDHWHYRQYRIFNEELIFIDNGAEYTKDMIRIKWNKKHTKNTVLAVFRGCYPSAVYTNGENTITLTDDYIIHIDLSKYGDITIEQNVVVNKDEQ